MLIPYKIVENCFQYLYIFLKSFFEGSEGSSGLANQQNQIIL